jgi:hypothetical protein
MAEPDEALLYGEKFSTVPWIQLVTAQAYRAGAAASAARIKALEARVAELEADDAIEWRKAAALMRQFFLAGREADQ